MSTQVLQKLARYVISNMTALGHSYKVIIRYISMSSGPSGIGQHSTPQTSSLLIGKALFWLREKSQAGAPLASALPRVNAPWISSSGDI